MKQLIFYLTIFFSCFQVNGNNGGINNSKEKTGCSYTKLKVDESSGLTVKIMEQELLLSHAGSDPKAPEIVGIDNPVAVYAHLANYNNSIVLYLKIQVLSTHATEDYGNIYMEDKLLLKLKDGEVVALGSGKSELGAINDAITFYSIFFPVNDEQLSKIKKQEATKVRIQWSKGYMDYQIDNRDFFIRQASCVE